MLIIKSLKSSKHQQVFQSMLHAGRRSILRFQNQHLQALFPRRSYSNVNPTPTPKRRCGLVQVAMIAGGTVLVVSASTVAYSKYDNKFRKNVEKYVPGSQTAMKFLLGSADYDLPVVGARKQTDMFEQPMVATKPLSMVDKKTLESSKQPDDESPETKPAPVEGEKISDTSSKEEVAKSIEPQTSPKEEVSKSVESQTSSADQNSNSAISNEPKEADVQRLVLQPDVAIVHNEKVKLSCKHEQKEMENNCSLNLKNPNPLPDKGTDLKDEPDRSAKVLARVISQDQQIDYESAAVILEDTLTACSVACAKSILLNNEAANAVEVHATLLRTAMDDMLADPNEKSQQWSDVGLALEDKNKKCGEADVYYDKAIEELTKLRQVAKQMDFDNVQIKTKVSDMERIVNDLTADLNDSLVKVYEKKISFKMLEEYQASIESAISDLQKNLNLPEGKKLEEWKRQGVQLKSREDMDSLRQLNKALEELQAKLVEERKSSEAKLQETIEIVRNSTTEQVKKESMEDAARTLEEKRIAYERAVNETREEFVRKHDDELKRQSAKHAEHLAEALAYMDKQAKAKYENALQKEIESQWEAFEKKLEAQKSSFAAEALQLEEKHKIEMNIAMARLRGIKQAVDGRADSENAMRKALELSLACNSLLDSLTYGNNGAPLPLKAHVETVRGVYGDHPAVAVLSSSLPAEVQERGAYPEATLQRNLTQVMKTCRRVSLVDENRNSLLVYFLSYLKSLLIVSNAAEKPPEFINVSELDCFKILSYANYCLQHGDIEQAVRFLNQMKGEPRKVAETWLMEARLYLETKQSVNALCSVADSVVIGVQLET